MQVVDLCTYGFLVLACRGLGQWHGPPDKAVPDKIVGPAELGAWVQI